MRRRTLLGVIPAVAGSSAGCLGVLTGDEPLEREATTARVGSATLSETAYELFDSYSDVVEREVTVAGQTRQVRAVNQVVEYARTVDLGLFGEERFAVFSVVSTPAFEIAGRTTSPVTDWSNRRIVEEIQQQYENLDVGAKRGEQSVATLSGELSLSKYEGTADISDVAAVDVFLHVGKIEDEEDFVLPVAVYPRRLSGEGDTVVTLVEGLTHG